MFKKAEAPPLLIAGKVCDAAARNGYLRRGSLREETCTSLSRTSGDSLVRALKDKTPGEWVGKIDHCTGAQAMEGGSPPLSRNRRANSWQCAQLAAAQRAAQRARHAARMQH
eukprot:6209630-Pleurochrysis_carterae.AAC.1